ncbi:hypothetical protein LTR93_011159 [Exophiala xenobiotica]|nr:hypothetical protein LTR93_011159 [Exophiala xenobiotica]
MTHRDVEDFLQHCLGTGDDEICWPLVSGTASSVFTQPKKAFIYANTSICAEANGDGDRWYQLYWPRPQWEEGTVSLLNRAKSNGYKVLVVTLDTFNLAWRPTDLDTSYLPFVCGDGCQVGHSDPVFNRRYEEMQKRDTRTAGEKLADLWTMLRRPGSIYGAVRVLANIHVLHKSRAWLDVLNSGTYREWEHLEILKTLWDGPIVLKGIQTVEDAHKAIDFGMDGIIVLQPRRPPIGIRTGGDILKALALGAKAVLIGRPHMYGLAIRGQQGVEHVLRCLLADTDNMLGNMGKKSIQDLSTQDLQIRLASKL